MGVAVPYGELARLSDGRIETGAFGAFTRSLSRRTITSQGHETLGYQKANAAPTSSLDAGTAAGGFDN
jgi:hypothetical protein